MPITYRLEVTRAVVVRKPGARQLAARVDLLAVPLEHRDQQGVLAGVVIEQPALADAGALRDGIQRQVARTGGGDELLRGVEDAIACTGRRGGRC